MNLLLLLLSCNVLFLISAVNCDIARISCSIEDGYKCVVCNKWILSQCIFWKTYMGWAVYIWNLCTISIDFQYIICVAAIWFQRNLFPVLGSRCMNWFNNLLFFTGNSSRFIFSFQKKLFADLYYSVKFIIWIWQKLSFCFTVRYFVTYSNIFDLNEEFLFLRDTTNLPKRRSACENGLKSLK